MSDKIQKRKVGFHTLGCKVNQYETDAVAQCFKKEGYISSAFDEVCDVYVINTCTVTAEASRKSGQFIRRARKMNSDAIIIEMGCRTQIDGASDNADISLGASNKLEIIDILKEYIKNKELKYSHEVCIPDISTITEFEEFGLTPSRDGTRAFVKIEDGCNRFCSYCIIPFARGRVRSRKEGAIIEEVKLLADMGYKEIVLTGIDLSSYGKDRDEEPLSILELSKKISLIHGIERIRLGSIEPTIITDEFINGMKDVVKLCPHIHMSVQSGSDSVLKRMNRHYTAKVCLDAAFKLRELIPSIMITADLITGFPGETDEEHQETLEFCKKMNFLDMHIFKYSKREGTKAATMPGQIPSLVSNKRSDDLIVFGNEMRKTNMSLAIGNTYSVLIENINENMGTGYTQNYMPVEIINIQSKDKLKINPGDIVDVKIKYISKTDNLVGNLL